MILPYNGADQALAEMWRLSLTTLFRGRRIDTHDCYVLPACPSLHILPAVEDIVEVTLTHTPQDWSGFHGGSLSEGHKHTIYLSTLLHGTKKTSPW